MIEKKVLISRHKTALLIATAMGLSFLIVTLPLLEIIINITVKKSENQFVQTEVTRVENIVQIDLKDDLKVTTDWSSWDDAYQFVQDENLAFVENNLTSTTFANLDLNSILVMNPDQKIVYSEYFDLILQKFTPFPFNISDLFKAFPELVEDISAPQQSGLIVFENQIYYIVSNPILTSANEGPSRGRMIFIRLIDEQVFDYFSLSTSMNQYLLPAHEYTLDYPQIPASSSMIDPIYLDRENENQIAGYVYLNDIRGNPSILLKVDILRDHYQQGKKTKRIVTVILIVWAAIMSLLAYPSSNILLRARERQKEEEAAKTLLEKSRQNEIELEHKVSERTKELELRNKDLETFNYTISHDLKSPLRGISGFATLLLDEHSNQLDKNGVTYLHHIVHSVDRMNNLIEDLLLFDKIERQVIKKTEINLDTLFSKLVRTYNDEIQNRKIQIIKNLEVDQLCSDRESIELILRNLIDNAIKFTQQNENPEITLSSKLSGNNVIISVTDNGIGFDPKYHEKIFEIFQRLHLAEEYPGTGAGLALVKKAAERLGGKVFAESESGKGSTFFIEIPMA